MNRIAIAVLFASLFTAPVFAQAPPVDTVESLNAQLAPLLAKRPALRAEADKLLKEKTALENAAAEYKKSIVPVDARTDAYNIRQNAHTKAVNDHNANQCQTTPSNPCAEYNAESGALNERTEALRAEHAVVQAAIDTYDALKAAILKRMAAYDVERLDFNARNDAVESAIAAIRKKIADLTPKEEVTP